MGMIVHVYRDSFADCTNGGVSSQYDGLCVVNVDGPFDPCDKYPAAKLVDDAPMGRPYPKIVPLDLLESNKWVMFGGNIAHTGDSRFKQAVEKWGGGPAGALPIFDRVEQSKVIKNVDPHIFSID